ncbi:MAG: DUF1566 domain-containing protein [Chlorobiaceae bacterium]|jgi:Protein of unknown function (DUF1566)
MKRYSKQQLFRLLIFAQLALLGVATASDKAVSAQREDPAKRLGTHYGGGIVCYLDATGQHGLIAAPKDLKDKMTWGKAITECQALEYEGCRDWRLPSLNELQKLYNAKRIVGSFFDTEDYYWSSSMEKRDIAWYQDFGDGSQCYGGKNFKFLVRAVRSF